MRTFIRLLITATIINTFVILYHNPTYFKDRDKRNSLSRKLALAKTEYVISFNNHAGQFLTDSNQRIQSLQTEKASLVKFIYGGQMDLVLFQLIIRNQKAVQKALTELNSFKDSWLLDLVLVKQGLAEVLKNELRIWDVLLAVSNKKHNLTKVKIYIKEFNASVARVTKTYKALLNELPT